MIVVVAFMQRTLSTLLGQRVGIVWQDLNFLEEYPLPLTHHVQPEVVWLHLLSSRLFSHETSIVFQTRFFNQEFRGLWVYFVGPAVGAVSAIFVYGFVHPKGMEVAKGGHGCCQ